MAAPPPTVFLSYRRNVSAFIARAVFQDLRQHGYDVFMDVESIDSGQFDTIILNQIAARGHFLVILTPGALDRCHEPDDWLRREIEYAIELGRNVVPILVNEFHFDDTTRAHLPETLRDLPRYNGLELLHSYFDAAMERLRTRFLKEPAQGVITPAPPQDAAVVQQKIEEAARQPAPTPQELSAEDYFNRGRALDDHSDEEIAYYTEALQLNPLYVEAYYHRGLARESQGDKAGAFADYTTALQLNPLYVEAYWSRGLARESQGDEAGAIADYTTALQLDPERVEAYWSRGLLFISQNNWTGAIADWTEALRLFPEHVDSYFFRGWARDAHGDRAGALADYEQYLALGGGGEGGPGHQETVERRIRALRAPSQGFWRKFWS
jgi:tetratricopeptide (TPR) repeat protein